LGFYRGVLAPLSALTALNAINFSSYAYFSSLLFSNEVTSSSISIFGKNYSTKSRSGIEPRYFLAGAAAGPLASCISTPFELVKTQVQINKKYGSTLNAIRIISTKYGPHVLLRGHVVNTCREMVFLGSYFFIYEHIKETTTRRVPAMYAIAVAGGIAGAIGWFVSFPLDSIKSLIQGSNLSESRPSAVQLAKRVLHERGMTGLYRGVAPSISRAFLVSSTRFSAYEAVMTVMRQAKE